MTSLYMHAIKQRVESTGDLVLHFCFLLFVLHTQQLKYLECSQGRAPKCCWPPASPPRDGPDCHNSLVSPLGSPWPCRSGCRARGNSFSRTGGKCSCKLSWKVGGMGMSSLLQGRVGAGWALTRYVNFWIQCSGCHCHNQAPRKFPGRNLGAWRLADKPLREDASFLLLWMRPPAYKPQQWAVWRARTDEWWRGEEGGAGAPHTLLGFTQQDGAEAGTQHKVSPSCCKIPS